jgi:hypothetical protein
MVDVSHTGRTKYICVAIVLCIFYVLFPHLFYLLLHDPVFLTTGIKEKGNSFFFFL